MHKGMSNLTRSLEYISNGLGDSDIDVDLECWRQDVITIGQYLRKSLSLDRIERIEAILKRYLMCLLRVPMSGADARFLAEWSRDVGFIVKYKPYGVKCTTPFGYSIFFQHPSEGFSFQRHVTRKIEIFHILRPLAGAKVFLSSSEAWATVYDPSAFAAWLDGKSEHRFDQFSRFPRSGDVYHLSELGVVHSVLGCVLEEFATVSTDMADRLHDQNRSRQSDILIGDFATRDKVECWLRKLPAQLPHIARWAGLNDAMALKPERFGQGEVVKLSGSGVIIAERYRVEARQALQFVADTERARVLFVIEGQCEALLHGTDEDASAAVPGVDLTAGDVVVIAPTTSVQLRACTKTSVSSHRVHPETVLA